MNSLQTEANLWQFIFCFVVINITIILGYTNRNKLRARNWSWILSLAFCVFAFWDTDYFTFKRDFEAGLEGFRDPFYYYLSFLSFKSYSIIRLIIWGIALRLFYLSCKKLEIPLNVAIFAFSVFFLITFSYARASLGMSAYFYGLILYLTALNKRKVLIKVGLCFFLAFLAHRSMLLLIILAPLVKVELSRNKILCILFLFPLVFMLFNNLFSSFISGELIQLGGGFEGVTEAAQKYSKYDIVVEKNWKFQLTSNLRTFSFYILAVYLMWLYYFSKYKYTVSEFERKLFNVLFVVLLFALSMQMNNHFGLSIIGYRYLYTTGIPLCILLSLAIQKKWCTYKTYICLLFPAFLYVEGFIFGKILSLI